MPGKLNIGKGLEIVYNAIFLVFPVNIPAGFIFNGIHTDFLNKPNNGVVVSPVIWEPACGEGHISKVLAAHGYEVISTDLIYRGFGEPEPMDFLTETFPDFEGDIITNPPYSAGLEFVKRALETVRPGGKVAMFLKVQFLEGKRFSRKQPPKNPQANLGKGKVYISLEFS